MTKSLAAHGMKITITKNGPYQIDGNVPLARAEIGADENGESREWLDGATIPAFGAYELCRCGHSANKPFCDGTHEAIGFDGSETASHAPYAEQAGVMEGPSVVLTDAEPLCAFARFCDRDGKVWNTVSVAAPGAGLDAFVRQVGQCPSGRLEALDLATGEALEPDLAPSIAVVSDPAQGVAGPLWVRGRIEIVGADGRAYERRNRVTLCRCGESRNKPFCDGSHASEEVMFQE